MPSLSSLATPTTSSYDKDGIMLMSLGFQDFRTCNIELCTSTISSPVRCPSVFERAPGTESCFLVVSASELALSQPEAEQECQSISEHAHLARLDSPSKIEYMKGTLSKIPGRFSIKQTNKQKTCIKHSTNEIRNVALLPITCYSRDVTLLSIVLYVSPDLLHYWLLTVNTEILVMILHIVCYSRYITWLFIIC